VIDLTIKKTCALATCLDPLEIGCNRGFESVRDCPNWDVSRKTDKAPTDEASVDATAEAQGPEKGERNLRLPWTGNSLGLLDLELITACNRATLLGLVGAFNSGKTTLLALIYLLIQRGELVAPSIFAGSWSLIGWEYLASRLRWKPGEGGPKFPPHTSRAAGRRPGILHMAVRRDDEKRHDFLLTDPPGEWFSAWAQKESAEGADGARWVQQHADRFLFLVDREALATKERGKERDSLRDLARRLAMNLGTRPIAIVWTKSDVEIPKTIEHDLQSCFAKEFPQHVEFRVRVRFGSELRSQVEEPCLRLMQWAFSPATVGTSPLAIPKYDGTDAFLAYRGNGSR
jgi:Double-GTPase 2